MTRRRAPVCVPEGSVLKPIDKTTDNNEWPSFLLHDAVVYRPDGVTLANALLVSTDGPFVVRGRFEAEDEEDLQYLVRPDVRSAYIQIDSSIAYSIGCNDHLTSAMIWVSGEAGWFQIVAPHPVYASIYRDMCDVTLLYHHLEEIYKDATSRAPTKGEQAKVRRTLSVKSILFEYAVAMGNGTTYEETVDMCVRLGPALLAHLNFIAKDYPWTSTSIYAWLTKELKDKESRGASVSDTQSRPSSVAPPVVATPPPAALSQQLPIRAPPMTGGDAQKPAARSDAGAPTPSQRQALLDLAEAYLQPGTSQSGTPLVPIPSASSGPEWDDFRHQLFLVFLAAVREIGQTYTERTGRPVSQMAQSAVHAKLYNYFKLRKYVMSKAMSIFFRSELESALGEAWQGGPYIKWLHSDDAEGLMPSSPELFLRSLSHQLHRRKPANTHPERTAAEADAVREGSVRATAGKRAILRPPGLSQKRPFSESGLDSDTTDSKHTRKTPRRDENGKFVVEIDDDDDDNDAHEDVAVNDGSNDHGDSDAMAVDEAGADSSDEESDDDDEDDADDGTALVVRSVPLLQPLRPTGPNRTWCCPEPGCSFFVRSAAPAPGSDASDDDDDDGGGGGVDGYEKGEDDDDGDGEDDNGGAPRKRLASATRRAQAQIRAHLRGHEEQTLDRMGLAMAEGSRGQVSVDHLLEKIRSLAEASQQRSLPAPSPIVRQFLV